MPAPLPAAVGWQRLEGALVMAAALALFAAMAFFTSVGFVYSLWLALLLFFAPDLSLLAYLAGPRVGAVVYNAVHIYGFGPAVIGLGAVFGWPLVSGLGLLWLAHAGFDRMLGYGLKLPQGFQHTHLGQIGRRRGGA